MSVFKQFKGNENWKTRNDSSLISSLLRQDQEEIRNGQTINDYKPLLSAIDEVKPLLVSNHCYEPHIAPAYSCNKCYCKKSPISPKHLKNLDQTSYNLQTNSIKRMHKMHKRRGYIYNSNDESYYPTRPREKKFNFDEPYKCGTCWKCCYSKSTPSPAPHLVNDHYRYSTPFEEEYRRVLDSCNKSEPLTKHFSPTPTIPSYSEPKCKDKCMSEIPTGPSKLKFLNTDISTDICLSKLNTFRKENYFDCHSTKPMQYDPIPEHKCVHKFTINDRLIPKPLNTDPFGISCCCTCNKPLKAHDSEALIRIVELEKSASDLDKKVLKHATTNTKPHDQKVEPRVTPSIIYLGAKKTKIEIKIPQSLDEAEKTLVTKGTKKVKPVITRNSFALRHQKGVGRN